MKSIKSALHYVLSTKELEDIIKEQYDVVYKIEEDFGEEPDDYKCFRVEAFARRLEIYEQRILDTFRNEQDYDAIAELLMVDLVNQHILPEGIYLIRN